MNNTLSVVLTFDKGYVLPATVTIFSLLKNHPHKSFKIYVICEDLDSEWLQPLQQMVENMGSEFFVKSLSLESIATLKLNRHFTLASYFRLFAAELVEESKVIYLDSDLLIVGDLTELWELDLGEFPLAATQDFLIEDFHRLDLTAEMGYFNSGVMILQLDLWRKMDLGKTVVDYLYKFPEKIEYVDQCGLNAVLKGNWYHLPPKFNLQSFSPENSEFVFNKSFSSKNDWNEAIDNPRIIHFTGLPKPWNLGGDHPYKTLYWKYLSQTPYARSLPLNFSVGNLLKLVVPMPIKKFYWRHFS